MAGFVDEAQVHVKGGDGGAGAVSFRREAHVPRGGPDGGNGGKGGDVWLIADRNVASLLSFRDHPHRRGTNGGHGQGKARHGAGGADLFVLVPEGTTVRDRDGGVVADLVHEGDRWLAAPGGRGGRGNASFLSNRRRAPSFAEQGEVGVERWLDLELRLIADVALVGFPNAGKSTLISRVSAAKPKIADYPFTTLEPHLGVVKYDDVEFVMADIPGLIEGASEGRGLGHQFLRHVERARALLVLLDLDPDSPKPPAEQERILLDELGRHRPELLHRPRLVVGSKADLADGAATPQNLSKIPEPRHLSGQIGRDGNLGEVFRMSAVTGEGVQSLMGQLAELVVRARDEQPVAETYVVHRPVPDGLLVERADDGAFVIHGRPAERAVAVSDITNPDALAFVQERLRRLGVDKALARAGARDGDRVRIATFEFDYETGDATGGPG